MTAERFLSLDEKLKFDIPPIDEDVVDYFLRREIKPISRNQIRTLHNIRPEMMDLHMLTSRFDSFWLWEAHKKYPDKFKDHIWALIEVEKIEKYMCGNGLTEVSK
jgi:hypothetical protein